MIVRPIARPEPLSVATCAAWPPDAAAAEGVVVRARRDFPVASLPRQPYLEVVALGRAESEVARAAFDDAVGQLESPQNRLGVLDHGLELVVRLRRRRELDQLDLIELVLAVDSLHVLAVRSCLPAIAGRERGVAPRQRVLGQHLSAVKRRERDFGGWDQVERTVLVRLDGFEELLLELGELAGPEHRLAAYQVWHPQLGVSVLASVEVEHEVGEGAFEAGSGSVMDDEA